MIINIMLVPCFKEFYVLALVAVLQMAGSAKSH